MTFKTEHPLFSKGLYIEGLKRLRAFGFIVLSIALVTSVMPLLASLFIDVSYTDELGKKIVTAVNMRDILGVAPTVCVFVAPLMVQSLFSVFNKRSSSDFFHSLPYTRPCIFLSFMASVYTWIIGICTTCSVASAILYAIQPDSYTVTLDRGGNLILSYIAVLLISTGATAIAMGLTGTNLTNVSVALIILFLPRFIITIITDWIANRASFIVINTGTFSILSPGTNVFVGMFYGIDEFFTNTAQDIYSIILGIAYLVLGAYIFIKRKSETATRPAPDRITQTIIRIMISLIMALYALTLLLVKEFTGFIVVGAIAVIVYFTYEIITTKSFKNCLKALPGLGVLAGLTVLCGIVMVAYPAVAARYSPDADKIDSIRFVNDKDDYYYYYDDNVWFGKGTENVSIKNKEVIEAVIHSLNDNLDYYNTHGGSYSDSRNDYVSKVVVFKDGLSVKYRRIFFTYDEYGKVTDLLQQNEAYKEAYKKLPDPVYGSFAFEGFDIVYDKKTVDALMSSLREEIEVMDFEDWYDAAKDPNKLYYDSYLSYYSDEYDSQNVYLYISADSFPKTFGKLLELSEDRWDENLKRTEKILGDFSYLEENSYIFASVDANVRMTAENGDPRFYSTGTTYDGYDLDRAVWEDANVRKNLSALLENAKSSKGKPTAENYICIYVTVESDSKNGYFSEQFSVYLPVPEDFDPSAFGFYSLEISY